MDMSDARSNKPERLGFSRNSEQSGPNMVGGYGVVPIGHLLQAVLEKAKEKRAILKRSAKSKTRWDQKKNLSRGMMTRNDIVSPRVRRCSITPKRRRVTIGRRYHCKTRVPGGSIYRRLKKLQRLIPGGKNMDADALFLETAEYIVSLKMQVHVLQTLSNLYTRYPHELR